MDRASNEFFRATIWARVGGGGSSRPVDADRVKEDERAFAVDGVFADDEVFTADDDDVDAEDEEDKVAAVLVLGPGFITPTERIVRLGDSTDTGAATILLDEAEAVLGGMTAAEAMVPEAAENNVRKCVRCILGSDMESGRVLVLGT
ncbi:hypothetical protein HDU77_000262 [Chytriomyces hyalinus]|nr:hypothetical protein HDU77_000262 [Chytriomyces hyalinus]